MSDAPIDPRWPKILSLSVHEFRTPMTVVAGYIRMLLKDRAGPLSDQQRKLLEEAEKSCGRLTALLTEVSDLSNLEGGTAPFNKHAADLQAALRDAVDQLPRPARPRGPIDLQLEGDGAPLRGRSGAPDAGARHRSSSRCAASSSATTRWSCASGGRRDAVGYEIQIGDAETIAALDAEDPARASSSTNGAAASGLSLPVARRIIEAHGGRIWAAPGRTQGRRAHTVQVDLIS